MTSVSSLFNPLTLPRLLLRAADDVHALADIARREPHPVDALEDAVSDARRDIHSAVAELRDVLGAVRGLDATAASVGVVAAEIVRGGQDLLAAGLLLRDETVAAIDGIRSLEAVGTALEVRTTEVVAGGRDLVGVSENLDGRLAALLGFAEVLERHLPELLQAVDAVDNLQESAETVAETVEPLQGAARRVGRLAGGRRRE